MAMQTLTGSQYNLRDIIDSAIQQTDMNLSNPLIDKSRINVINYYSAMAQYMIAAETNNDKLVNAAHKNVRDALNGNDLYLENDIYFREAKKRVEEFIGQNIGTQDGTGYYEVITNSNACGKCKELSHRGKLSDIDNALLPPYHPNCKCRVEMFDSVGNAINISEKINNIVDSSSNAKAIPWYLWLLNELGDKEEDFIKKFSKGNIGGVF